MLATGAADVAEDAADVGRCRFLEPVDLALFLGGVHAAIDMGRFATEGRRVGRAKLLLSRFSGSMRLGGSLALPRRFNASLVCLNDFLEHLADLLRRNLVRFLARRRFDHLAESHGFLHRCGVFAEVFGEAQFAERFPATNDAGRVVHFQLVVVVLEQILKSLGDVVFVDGEDDDLVVGQEVTLDRFGEGDDVKLLAVERFIVHRTQGHVLLNGRGFGEVGINARRRGHVEPLLTANEVGLVNAHERRFLFVVEGGSGGAMGFVADDKIEFREAEFLLSFMDDFNGVIGGKDDAHVPGVVPLGHLFCQPLRVRGRRITKFVDEGLDHIVVRLALLADFGVRADRETVQRRFALLSPFGQRLGQQREAGDQEQNSFVAAGDFFGDLQRGEGLAGAAGHDQLASVFARQAEENALDRFLLMRARIELGLEDRAGIRLVFRPVNLAGFEIVQVDARDRRLLIEERGFGVLGPLVGRGDDDSVSEGLLPGSGEEAVDVTFLDAMVFRVELALDRVKFPGASRACDQVDAGVVGTDSELGGDIGQHPDVAVEVRVSRLIPKVDADQLFKVGAFFPFGDGRGSKGGQDLLERREESHSHSVGKRAIDAATIRFVVPKRQS